jgi:hypothetical protein
MKKLFKQLFAGWRFIPYTKLPARPVITVALKQFEERNHGLDH